MEPDDSVSLETKRSTRINNMSNTGNSQLKLIFVSQLAKLTGEGFQLARLTGDSGEIVEEK